MRMSILIWCVCLIIAGCIESKCENVVLKEIISPNGKQVAVLFERSCGATTPFVQVVMIRESGSAFKADDPESFIFTMRGKHEIGIQWEAADHLIIKRPQDANDIFKEIRLWKGTKISYTAE